MHVWARRLLLPRVWVPAVVLVLFLAFVGVLHRSDASSPPGMPLREWRFGLVVRLSQYRVEDGNPVTLVSARHERDRRLCSVLHDRRAARWVGRLQDVSTTLQEKGVVKVALDDGVMLHTASGALLRPGTAVFESVANLHDGDRVMFSGRFVAGGGDTCLKSLNLFHKSAVMSPDFAFTFKQISAAQ